MNNLASTPGFFTVSRKFNMQLFLFFTSMKLHHCGTLINSAYSFYLRRIHKTPLLNCIMYNTISVGSQNTFMLWRTPRISGISQIGETCHDFFFNCRSTMSPVDRGTSWKSLIRRQLGHHKKQTATMATEKWEETKTTPSLAMEASELQWRVKSSDNVSGDMGAYFYAYKLSMWWHRKAYLTS